MDVNDRLAIRAKHYRNELKQLKRHYLEATDNLKSAVKEGKVELVDDIEQTLSSISDDMKLVTHRIETLQMSGIVDQDFI